eukprot:TRINITY_DN1288_c0_g1_i1.p1 TRINITY_DN1288_c0_g1~~TRINITY_DN1288_c0_g1_i1.p1  ORF type:complete len:642 (+),score=119.44 TRINITY_DN1288_c0_g1_i1:231-1928(+)
MDDRAPSEEEQINSLLKHRVRMKDASIEKLVRAGYDTWDTFFDYDDGGIVALESQVEKCVAGPEVGKVMHFLLKHSGKRPIRGVGNLTFPGFVGHHKGDVKAALDEWDKAAPPGDRDVTAGSTADVAVRLAAIEERFAKLSMAPAADATGAEPDKTHLQYSFSAQSSGTASMRVASRREAGLLTNPRAAAQPPRLRGVEWFGDDARSGDDKDIIQSCFHNLSGRCRNVVAAKGKREVTTAFKSRHGHERKPDVVVYAAGQKEQPSGIVALIELKATGRSAWKSDMALDQLLVNLEVLLLDIQQWRLICYGAITDNENVLVVRVHRTRARRHVIFSEIIWSGEFLDNGARWLKWLCTAEPAELGHSLPTVSVGGRTYCLADGEYLGSGRHVDAFAVAEDVVVKVYVRDKEKEMQTELKVLAALRDVSHVSQLVEQGDGYIVLQPRGRHFSERPPTKAHIKQLCGALKVMHAAGVYHGDICGTNVYFRDEEYAFINDFGSSTIVEDGRDTTELIRQDLHQLISMFIAVRKFPPEAKALFRSAFGQAFCGNYDGVEEALLSVLCAGDH